MFPVLEKIRLYYKAKGIRIKVIRTDDFTTFKSRKVRNYYAKHGIEYPLPALAELSRARHPDDDTQHISRHPRIATHACGLLESSAQTLDQSAQ